MRSRVLVAVLAVIAAGVGLTNVSLRSATAQTSGGTPGLNFWIAVSGVPTCNTKDGDATCNLAPGTTFVIETHLDPLPSGVPGYGGFDISLRHTGVTPNHDASTDAWPDCSFPAAAYDEAPDTDIVAFGCAVGVPPAGASTYVGLTGTVSFVCAGSGSVSLVHGDGHTDMIGFPNIALHYFEDPNTSETLTINCVQGGVTPIPTTPGPGGGTTPGAPGATTAQGPTLEPTAAAKATATAQSKATATAKAVATAAKQTPTVGGTKGGGGGLAGWVIAVIIVGGVAAAGAAGVLGWRVMQSRRAPGP